MDENPGLGRHPIRVLHISTFDALGGAARAANRIHQGLRTLGVDSQMLVWRKSTQDESISEFQSPRSLLHRINQRWRRDLRHRQLNRYVTTRRDAFQPFSDDRTDNLVDISSMSLQPDIVNLYWIAGFPDLSHFFSHLPAELPIVWRLSDMNPFTGGCHYAGNCQNWTHNCGKCPELGSNNDYDLSHHIWNRKQRAFSNRKIHIVAPSRWIANAVKDSSLLGERPLTVIPNGVDTSLFCPHDRLDARRQLNLPVEGTIILGVAGNLADNRKGYGYLVDALNQLSPTNKFELLTIGDGDIGLNLNKPSSWHQLGRIEDDRLLSLAYSSADFFVLPSVEENLPNTALESMACGTPVVAFDSGGIPEIIEHGHTGLLARSRSAIDLAKKIELMLEKPEYRIRMGVAARDLVRREHKLEEQSQRFLSLYLSVLVAKGA